MTMDAQAQQHTIIFLEKALADTKADKMQGVVCIAMGQAGTAILNSGGTMETKYTMLSLLRHRMMDEMSAAMGPKQSSLVRAGSIPRLPGLNGNGAS